MRRIDLTDGALTRTKLSGALLRAALDTTAAAQAVAPIVARVGDEGTPVLYELAGRFDHARLERLRVPVEALTHALKQLDPQMCKALETSIEHNRISHTQRLPAPSQTQITPGDTVERRQLPVGCVGLYVPGGLVVYPSSVIMDAVYAQVAKVGLIVLAPSPQAEFGGLPHPAIPAAYALLDVDEVWAIGGVQAITAPSYGIAGGGSILQPVDVTAGPGSICVAAAKRPAQGTVGIDAETGMTEIAVLTDKTATPEFVATGLISQAEYDLAAVSVFIITSAALAKTIDAITPTRARVTTRTKRTFTALSGPQFGIIIVDTLNETLEVISTYAVEYLEIHTANVSQVAQRAMDTGAVFVGPHTPTPPSGYIVGSNHIPLIGGTTHLASDFSVTQYPCSQQIVECAAEALAQLTSQLNVLAREESLSAHGQAALIRARKGASQ